MCLRLKNVLLVQYTQSSVNLFTRNTFLYEKISKHAVWQNINHKIPISAITLYRLEISWLPSISFETFTRSTQNSLYFYFLCKYPTNQMQYIVSKPKKKAKKTKKKKTTKKKKQKKGKKKRKRKRNKKQNNWNYERYNLNKVILDVRHVIICEYQSSEASLTNIIPRMYSTLVILNRARRPTSWPEKFFK